MKLSLLSTIATAVTLSACIGAGEPAVSTTETTAAKVTPAEVELDAARVERDVARRELAEERRRAFEADRDRRARDAILLASWTRLERADAALDDMRHRAVRAAPGDRRFLELSIERGESARAVVIDQLRRVHTAPADSWPELRDALTRSIDALEQAVGAR